MRTTKADELSLPQILKELNDLWWDVLYKLCTKVIYFVLKLCVCTVDFYDIMSLYKTFY